MRKDEHNDKNILYDFSMNDLESEDNQIKFKNTDNNDLELIDMTSQDLNHANNSQLVEINSDRKIQRDKFSYKVDYLENMSRSIPKTIVFYLKSTNPLQWFFLLCFSLIITVICFVFDYLLRKGLNFRLNVCSSDNTFFNLLFWVSSCFILLLLATSAGYFISSDADGSGIPELKTVISGINIYRYFSVEAFVAKVLGLLCAIVGGKIRN